MLPPIIPKMRNKTSHILELSLALALLTIAIVTKATSKKKINAINEPTPYDGVLAPVSMWKTFVMSKTEKTIPTIQRIAMIHVKKLAMLYITLDALSIYKSPLFSTK